MRSKKKMIIALGSNYNQLQCMDLAVKMLAAIFNYDVVYSKSAWTTPIGIESDMFLNRILVTNTSHKYAQICKALKDVEHRISKVDRQVGKNIVPIDIDILQYGDEKYHVNDWERSYIEELLADIETQK